MPLFEVTWIESRRGETLIEAESEADAVEILASMDDRDLNRTVKREDFDASAVRV